MKRETTPTLYDASFEHDSCGIGAVVSIDGIQSHELVHNALCIVEKLEHRAGKDADGKTGDGVGILVQISHSFFKSEAAKCNITLGDVRDYGIGMFFFPQDSSARKQSMECIESLCKKAKLPFLGWRTVPVNDSPLGDRAKDCMPYVMQCFVGRPKSVSKGIDFDRALYNVRRQFEKINAAYIVSFSSRTIVYKGMLLVNQLRTFYTDLESPEYASSIAIVHSRFSTNTNPSWERAHPNRLIAHNGEINTIRGNIDRMIARDDAVNTSGSDSAILDNTLEYLLMNGIPLPLAVMICIPEPWKHNDAMMQDKKDFYHYWSTMMESWDGPAAILFSDGDVFGATLDRNGLRPSRYYITKSNMLILSSEVGVLDIPEDTIVKKSRLQPGKMLLVDTVRHCLISDDECKKEYASAHPYGEWLDQNLMHLHDIKIPNKKIPVSSQEERLQLYKAFGWNYEDINEMILPMAKNGIEPTGSMGVDTPLAVLSNKHPPLFSYFKQVFAQVTNPPIDSLREKIVTDTTVYLGSDGNLFKPDEKNCAVLEINNPILTGVDILKIKSLTDTHSVHTATVSLLYDKNTTLETALQNLFASVDNAYNNGSNIVILSDRGVDKNHLAIPSLIAVSGVEQHLIAIKKRTLVSIVLETADVRDVHQAAMILGYGARAVNPYLAHECIAALIDKKILDKDYHTAIDDYNTALLNGVVKIAAKMGISTIQSYQSAQEFEAVGIKKEVIDTYFTNTVSRIGGIGLEQIDDDVKYRHAQGFDVTGFSADMQPDSIGNHKLRRGKQCEDHLYSPEVIIALQEATRHGDYKRFKEYTSLVDSTEHPCTLRSLLDFDMTAVKPVSLDEVESVASIVHRFKTGAMSYGSISEEAHKCMAAAMNHLGGKSNSGEGGEKSERFGTEYNSAIKQVASGRFGVTEEYLLSAAEIQIKMAQGAKPGEGGHLPGKKVYPWIAHTRFATPGVSLISPPPHHDIYSIEDLAQLIYDLKNANRNARISVKLVSESGVGTIAAGVAKAGSSVIVISGHDGGTGAAPISSIHHAGLPWELGLAETHQTLLKNGLRGRVILETDGKLMSGRDVAIACLLGAEEFGFATAPLITMGCAMMRVCNLDTCPFGIATQNKDLRKNFKGKPEYVENFMRYIAQELREYMAQMGFHTVEEMVGHTELLKMRNAHNSVNAHRIDMSRIISYRPPVTHALHYNSCDAFNFQLESTVDMNVLIPALKNGALPSEPVALNSTNRTAGTMLGAEIQKQYGSSLDDDSFVVQFTGSGGQSFGAFIPRGLTVRLSGDANDYVGKGLSGGKIVIYPPSHASYQADENIVIGNVALYGATSGSAFISGIAGERFCVRNSGATAVVEGCGDHALEYMTGGVAVILGRCGKNVCAGMSGGVAYILDTHHDLYQRLNKGLVTMSTIRDSSSRDAERLKSLIAQHVAETGSKKGKMILDSFDSYLPDFKKIIPNDYQKIQSEIEIGLKNGMAYDEAEMSSFKKITQ